MEMIRTVAKAWKIPDIRKKIIFTLLMLVVFRVGSQIPVPGIDREILAQTFDSETGLFALFNLFSGGAFSQFTIFALSITPYITASIILQLLTIAIPSLERLAREGVEGRKKIAAYTRYMTVVLAIIQAIGVRFGLDPEDSKKANIEKLRYHKIIMMADADVDGAHIGTLIMTLFYRYMPEIIEGGHLYKAMPPLYLCSKGKVKKYCYDDKDKDAFVQEYAGGNEKDINIQRYKGLGEMNPQVVVDYEITHLEHLIGLI